MSLNEETLRVGRERLLKIYHYLEALNQHRNPVKRQVQEQGWALWFKDLPDHPAITRGVVIANVTDDEQFGETSDDFILKSRRPKLTDPPSPPDLISEWLEYGWKIPGDEVKVKETRHKTDEPGATIIERFDADRERVTALTDWQTKWNEWNRNERPARQAMKIFERLYELYGRIQKEAERVELVLGDGILYWPREEGEVRHPVVLQRLQLDFNPNIPEFVLSETDHGVELYSALFRSMPDVDGQVIARCREELQQGVFHPLGGDDTSGFLKRFVIQLSPRGEFSEEKSPPRNGEYPMIGRDPVIFVRDRTQGYGVAIQAIIEDLKNREDLPKPLLNISGIESLSSETGEFTPGFEDTWSEPEDILLGKPANPEQIAIAKSIERHDGILVQGPPGTGKTHTIANLIGHLLAQGKSVLVTSHTTKALRVLREQVVEEIRPLCVSVLESDSSSRKQLESSIEGIVHRLSTSDLTTLTSTANMLANERQALISQLKQIRQTLIEARTGEYRDLIISGVSYAPSEAARKIAQEFGVNDWIPKPVNLGAMLPFTESEFIELYRTNVTVTEADESELRGTLPNPSDLLMPQAFTNLLEEINQYAEDNVDFRKDLWIKVGEDVSPDDLDLLLNQISASLEGISDEIAWKLATLHAGYKGEIYCEPWEHLLTMIEQIHNEAVCSRECFLRFQPVVSDYDSLEKQLEIVNQIIKHIENGQNINKIVLLTHLNWKKFVENSIVKGKQPILLEHFKALHDQIHLSLQRTELKTRWDLQLAPLGAYSARELGEEPEIVAYQYCGTIRNCLDWHSKVWSQFEMKFESLGFQWKVLLEESQQNLSPYGAIIRLKETVTGSLRTVLAARVKYLRLKNLTADFEKLENTLVLAGENCPNVVRDLREAVKNNNRDAYHKSFQRLVDLYNRRSELERRQELLNLLEKEAPGWAKKIRLRIGIHGEGKVPGDVRASWLWRQIYDELERRSQISLIELQEKIERLTYNIREITKRLIETRAWAAQLKRTRLNERQSLVGYLELMKKIGSGTGKRVPRLRIEARSKMSECRTAVPVWIMPLSQVVENFDLKTTRFDVVIIDEASQCDVMGLIAIYMAKKVIIVGDHEQVSPLAIGQKQDEVQHLIDEYLQGIPNHMLYDGQMSVYDLARASFGGTICLVEHFRCVPEIIQFSNYLSYDGKIKPLRDTSCIKLKPALVPYPVSGGISDEKTNYKEAEAIVSLILSAIGQPEYKDKTLGVITLLGEEQAIVIERLLRSHLSEDEYSRRNIICGNAAHFQGDERDIIFLSLVYGPSENPPFKMLDAGYLGMYKKRYNVAASRAREQMWVVYSLDPQVDLKPGDIRRRLIQHAEDPYAISREFEAKEKRVESPFEKEVLKRLSQAGYRVTPRWKVGSYSIDLVIEGENGKRLAVECDGDRYHPIEKISEDMSRQALLERLGWTFVRIRGSHFFRKPDDAMKPIYQRLNELEIGPVSQEHNEDVTPQGNELTEKIFRRAAEVRHEWSAPTSGGSKTIVEELGLIEKRRIEEPKTSIIQREILEILSDDSELKNKTSSAPIRHGIVSERTDSDQNLNLENEILDITEYFKQRNIEIIDKRSIGGPLWVIGGKELAATLEVLKQKGYRFKLFEKGVATTNNRAAWCSTNIGG